MKKAVIALLSLSMLAAGSFTAFADDSPPPNTAPGEAVIRTEVPAGHKVTVTLIGDGSYTLDGSTGAEFSVERLSQPTLEITPGERGKIVSVTLNGEDITGLVSEEGKYTLDPVYEDKDIVITIETSPPDSEPDSVPDPVPDNVNPPTGGIIGGVSAGTVILLAAMSAARRKEKNSNK